MTNQPDNSATTALPDPAPTMGATQRMELWHRACDHTRYEGPAYKALKMATGEQVLSINLTTTGAVVVFIQRYGRTQEQGTRTVVLNDPTGDQYELVIQTFVQSRDPGELAPDYIGGCGQRTRPRDNDNGAAQAPRTSGVAGPATRPVPDYVARLSGHGGRTGAAADSTNPTTTITRTATSYQVVDRVTDQVMATTTSYSFAMELHNQYRFAVDRIQGTKIKEVAKQPLIEKVAQVQRVELTEVAS